MRPDNPVQAVCDQIIHDFSPDKLILYNLKKSPAGRPKSFKICVVANTENTAATEKQIYLDIDCDIPFDVLVYTPDQWEWLQGQEDSFASRIIKEGTYIYGEGPSAGGQ